MSAAFDYRGAREAVFSGALPGALKLLLLALVEYMPHCSPSVATLAKNCGVERKTILRGLASLERACVLAVERRPGARSVYALRPPADWRFGYAPEAPPSPVPTNGTGTALTPVPDERTGPAKPPVPEKDGTGTTEGMGPVPTEPQTGPTVGPKAGRSGSESGSEAARAHGFEVLPRAFTMPSEEPTESYLGACVMAGVSPAQARSTWSHYVGKGLPLDGVERLEWWLVQRAKEKQNKDARAPASGRSGEPPADPVEFDPRYLEASHRDFCGRHGLNADKLAREWRKTAVASGRRYTRAEADRAFGEFIRKRAREKGASR